MHREQLGIGEPELASERDRLVKLEKNLIARVVETTGQAAG